MAVRELLEGVSAGSVGKIIKRMSPGGNVKDALTKEKERLERIKQETDTIKPKVPPKATGLPEPQPKPKSTNQLLEESKRLQRKYGGK